MPVPDLLSDQPAVRLDTPALKQVLTLAFASGVPSSVFAQLLEKARLPASSWDPASFARELFLPDLIAGCCKVTVDGHAFDIDRANLARVLSRPPSSLDAVEARRDVLRELSGSDRMRSDRMRSDLERIYAALYQFRSLLENPPGPRRVEANRRRLEILGAAKSAVDLMAEAFEGAKSALLGVREFGQEVRAGDGFRRLAALLDYHENLSTLDVRVRIGLDGHVRGLEMLAIRENTGNWFYASPMGRFLGKLVSLFRGYRFSEQEMLARIIDSVFEGIEDEIVQLFQLIGDIEFHLAAMSFRDLALGNGLEVCLPEIVSVDSEGRSLRDLFNPHLLASGVRVVPCDVGTPRYDMTMIVTGPNSGGKTRLLQSLAIAQLFGQAGFFVPAREARLRMA